MAVDTRRCFWFGTEERMTMFATPLQGAESSPEGWSADGTLLNGGAYGLHSWGSHKRYTYEWPQSSSPETAQMMKSYRDGTYGRGLLYFLEPGIYRTNTLPAHWADPSMSLDNEAPSLVYNVDPTPVATSGASTNNLPVTSAHYNLTSNPQTQPSLESSVFLPIPEGHTLFLGAFYSSTGTGGVYATPVNSNGTYGTAVKLTELANNSARVVTESFSGIRGIRLWVGRTTSATSTVTLTAMTGRLLQTSDTVNYGPWVEQRRNLSLNPRLRALDNWVFGQGAVATAVETASGIQVDFTAPSAANSHILYQTAEMPITGGVTVSGSFEVEVPSGFPAVAVRVRLQSYGTPGSVLNGNPVTVLPGNIETIPSLSLTTAAGETGLRVIIQTSGIMAAGSRLFIRNNLSVATSPSGTYFDGNTNPDGDLLKTFWVGTEDDSQSVEQTRTQSGNPVKENQLKSGPWIGGQGHSGCRFLGAPSYVTNSPIEGGRVGFAASFVEVGSWVYG